MKRILIFDAYPSVRELLAEELAAEGNTVIPIANPDLISQLIITFEPDLFILDSYLRGEMKWELLDSVKMQNPNLPIILFTECSTPGPHSKNADACLFKSHIFDQLKQKIKEFTKERLPEKKPVQGLIHKNHRGAVL